MKILSVKPRKDGKYLVSLGFRDSSLTKVVDDVKLADLRAQVSLEEAQNRAYLAEENERINLHREVD